MKLKENLVLQQVADTWTVLPLGRDVINFDGIMTLNDAGVLLWKKLKEEVRIQDLVKELRNEYDVSEEQALADVEEFIEKLSFTGCLQA